MSITDELHSLTLGQLIALRPEVEGFLQNLRLGNLPRDLTLKEGLLCADRELLECFESDAHEVINSLSEWLAANEGAEACEDVRSITIIGGVDKSGNAENTSLTVARGDVVSIVGPTGAGKSRLLEDIECLAQGDTPTKRRILINGSVPDEERRFSHGGRLVAELSQNMNFIVDLSVRDFLLLHAQSRRIANAEEMTGRCFECANSLSGESFSQDAKITQLSGGQSRALMIADVAHLCRSPIVLVDEIENAGVDRRRAIELLASEDKLVLISTHDPILALGAKRRIALKNGGISRVIEHTANDADALDRLLRMDGEIRAMREKLRAGEELST